MAFDIQRFDSNLIGGNHIHTYRAPVDSVAAQLGANYFDNKELAYRVKLGDPVILVGVAATAPETQLGVVTEVDAAVPTVTIAKTILV